MRDKKTAKLCRLFFVIVSVLNASPSAADAPLFVSGSVTARGVQALGNKTQEEDPGFEAGIKAETTLSSMRFQSWLEGGWDGTVKRPARDDSLFKNYREVYQSNTPYLEFKELYITHAAGDVDVSAGIQRFAWGRLDEYPVNDLLNPWDYTRFLRKPLEDRKIGVPSVSVNLNRENYAIDAVWVPVLVPYRLPMPDERWAGAGITSKVQQVPGVEIVPQEPDLPERTVRNSNIGFRMKRYGDIEWALNLYHGFDPRPVFRTTALVIAPRNGSLVVDPGFVPDFHRITTAGLDAAVVKEDLSIRAELAYTFNRYLNIRREQWGYPPAPMPGITPLNQIQEKHDMLDYGIGADYRAFEDGLLTFQAQQTLIFGNVDSLFEKKVETLLWANLKAGFMNQKIETNINLAYNPEHGSRMSKINGRYVWGDHWKTGVTYVAFTGPEQALFGRFSRNDQVEGEMIYSW